MDNDTAKNIIGDTKKGVQIENIKQQKQNTSEKLLDLTSRVTQTHLQKTFLQIHLSETLFLLGYEFE